MNLRSKLLLGIGIALIITFSLVAVFSYISLEQSYRTLENQEIQKAVESTAGLLATDTKNTYSIARDYAVWSETYRFVQDENPDWVDQNMGDDFFKRFDIDIDYVLLYNRSNHFVYGKGYDSVSQKSVPVPASLAGDLKGLNSALDNTSAAGTTGIISTVDGIFMIGSHPVLKDNFEGPAAGSLQIVRRADSRYLTALGERPDIR